MNIDIGCGANKRDKFVGIDKLSIPGVDIVHDITVAPWPLADNTVDSAFCNHVLEHLEGYDRITFFNELWRVLKPGAQAQIITPHWSSHRAYGDVDHKWPPVVEHSYESLNPEFRQKNQPHLVDKFKCNFTVSPGYNLAPWLATRNQDFRDFAIMCYREALLDLIVTVTAVK